MPSNLASPRRCCSCSRVSRNTPPPPRANCSHTNGRRGQARRTARSVLPTSTMSSPRGRRCRAASRRMMRTESSPERPAASATRGSCRYSGGSACSSRAPHVRRIRHDDIVGCAAERAEVVGPEQPHAPRRRMATHVAARHARAPPRRCRAHPRAPRAGSRAGDRDAAGAGADIEHAPHAARVDPGREAPLDQLRERRARDQHARIDVQPQAGEPGDPGEVGRRDALADAPREQRVRAALRARADAAAVERPPARSGRRSACSTSAAASSQALSVPCPKNTRARRRRAAPRAMSARTVTRRRGRASRTGGGPRARRAARARRAGVYEIIRS